MRYSTLLAALVLTSLTSLSACSLPTWVAENVHPYRINVRQGNYVDQAMVSQLRKGMSQDQVRFLLGTPLLVDIFHSNRWDYVYRFKQGTTGEVEERKISVFFVDGKLDYVEGDVVAGTPGDVAATAPAARVIDLSTPGVAAPPPEESSSWWKFW